MEAKDDASLAELLPCPFCGSEELGLNRPTDQRTGPHWHDWFIRCYGCHVETSEYSTEHEAIVAWNRRQQSGEAVERRPILLEMAAADDEHRKWERRWHDLQRMYAVERIFEDEDGRWGLRDFLSYAGQVCGYFPPSPTPKTEASEIVPVEQVDRDAANIAFDDVLSDAGSYAEYMRRFRRAGGVRTLTEAFARHRLAALSTAQASERKQIAAWLRRQAEENNRTTEHYQHWAGHFADAIERGDHLATPVEPSPVDVERVALAAENARLRAAALAVLAHRVDGPTRGWLRDNQASREALDGLSAALQPPPVEQPAQAEGGE